MSPVVTLAVLDLRWDACLEFVISTDIVGANAQDEARNSSQVSYGSTDLEGIIYWSRLRKRHDRFAVCDWAMPSNVGADPLVASAATVPALRGPTIALIA